MKHGTSRKREENLFSLAQQSLRVREPAVVKRFCPFEDPHRPCLAPCEWPIERDSVLIPAFCSSSYLWIRFRASWRRHE